MNLATVQTYMLKHAADEEGGMPFRDALQAYDKRLEQYGNEATTDVSGNQYHKQIQSLGMIMTALIGATGGAILGGMTLGPVGTPIGAGLGAILGQGINNIGKSKGRAEPARTKEQQKAYTNSSNGYIEELLVPGVAGYERGRTGKHIDETVAKEFDKYKVN